ncbi:MAG: PQQ-binding-like beta-propeller repeat protein [Verrucomicrobia bacterium]|nr:PQQ-binding-like beta-propeller repeat protein [Verrucomicrobiota bacterium]
MTAQTKSRVEPDRPRTGRNGFHEFSNRFYRHSCRLLICALVAAAGTAWVHGADQPQWGQAWSRNMVSSEKALPESFDPAPGHNIKWTARLGTESHSTPVIARGRVLIGTNNGEPRDPKHQGDRGVLMCFDEKDGRLVWQLVVPKREEDPYHDWPNSGISSPATIEGDRVYIVSNRGEVLCLDLDGMANGNDGPFQDEGAHMMPKPTAASQAKDAASAKSALRTPHSALLQPGPLDADILWLFNLTTGAGIWSHDAAHSSILIRGDHLYLNSGTGVDNTHKRIRTPDAPSLVVLDKRTGQLLARENERNASRIFHCTWSAPSLGEVQGRPLIFFAGGDGIVYAFEPITSAPTTANEPAQNLKLVWRFDFDPTAPKDNVHRYNSNRQEGPSNIYGMPVFHHGRIFAAGGGDLFWGKNEAWLKCIDATQTGDITRSGEVWTYPLVKHTVSTAAVHDGLVFIADVGRTVHCVDAGTGKPYWTHELKGDIWASPLVADGKVYIGTRRGDFWVFAASREKRIHSTVELGSPISATAMAANGVLYVATMKHLYAVAKPGR